jgi:GTP-binding protein HflX
VAAFRATLEQVQYADVILHVRDISSPDTDAQREDVVDILKGLGIEYETDPRIIEVLNKMDLLSDEAIIYREPDFRGRQIELSAISGEGVPDLLDAIEKVMAHSQNLMKIRLSVTEGKALAWLHRHASIVSRTDNEEDISLEVSISPSEQEKFLYQFPNIKAS